jgi:hypothetical protein
MLKALVSEALDNPDATARTARKIVRRYTLVLKEDSKKLLDIMFMWKTYKFIVAVGVWGAFVPAACLSQVFVSHDGGGGSCCGFCMSFMVWAAYVIFPFLFLYVIVPGVRTTADGGFDSGGLYSVQTT